MTATPEHIDIRLRTAQNTQFAGASLVDTLYSTPVDILLIGELGAGKTTFLQGFAKALGIEEHVTSPTYALEQRYQTKEFGELIHIDLYRLEEGKTAELLSHSDDHMGIRVIEWSDRMDEPTLHPSITIKLEETDDGRLLTAEFADVPLPSEKHITAWKQEMMLPGHIEKHCQAVGKKAKEFAELLLARGVFARPEAAFTSGILHDLLRFVDFRPGGGPADVTESSEEVACWNTWREKFPNLRHEAACAAFVTGHGFIDLGEIITTHGVREPHPRTTEQKLLYYADKRVAGDTPVTLDERFADFADRYNQGAMHDESYEWLQQARDVEADLFPSGAPA